MYYPIVMFVGKAGSGKDTAAQMVRDLMPGSTAIALADPLKEFARTVFGFSHEQMYGPSRLRSEVGPYSTQWVEDSFNSSKESFAQDTGIPLADLDRWMKSVMSTDRSGRYILQTLGTEVGRAHNPNVWIDLAIKNAGHKLADGASLVTITDGRFRNEVLRVKELGGVVINIRNPDQTGGTEHSSEKEQDSIPAFWYNAVIHNDKHAGLLPLQMKLRMVIGKYLTPDVFWTTKLSQAALEEV